MKEINQVNFDGSLNKLGNSLAVIVPSKLAKRLEIGVEAFLRIKIEVLDRGVRGKGVNNKKRGNNNHLLERERVI